MLAGTIGSRAAGTPANAQARAYIIDQLKLYGFDVRVQETDARRVDIGRTTRVSNIIATLAGDRPEAIGLLAHYDSGRETPGAGDDAFGVAVCLEAARSLASQQKRTWSLFVLLTDAEELGLMGAAALMTDREVSDRLRAYLNIEAVGSGLPVMLFETGPENSWLVSAWAKHAPHPRGGSLGIEVYRRLPNDTDFSMLKRHGVPGLNFAAVGNSQAYHTARDTADRLSPRALREMGENTVSIVTALQQVDITQRTTGDPTYFDVAGAAAFSYGRVTDLIIAVTALLLSAIALVRTTVAVIRMAGVLRWLVTLIWSLGAVAVTIASMVGATWALRAAREVYHPWYSHPDRLLMLLAAVGAAVGWAATRLGEWLPARAHGARHPAVVWSTALPLWILLAMLTSWVAPAAAYLWTIPLLAAGLLLAIVPASNEPLVRAASVAILAVSATMWVRTGIDLSRFVVAVFGRLPMITPVFVYAVLLSMAGLMVVPPLVAAIARPQPMLRPTLMTAVCLIAVAIASGLAYVAPAYTADQPLRRHVRAIQDGEAAAAVWEVASTEPGLDLESGAPGGWVPASGAPKVSAPVAAWGHPFVFRANGPALGPPPANLTAFTYAPVTVGTGIQLEATVVPSEPGLTITFVAPAGMKPARSNLPGVVRADRWIASYVAPPADGFVWRASLNTVDAGRLADTRILVTSGRFPGGAGWQSLPAWLPQERTVWTASATWILTPQLEPAIPLR